MSMAAKSCHIKTPASAWAGRHQYMGLVLATSPDADPGGRSDPPLSPRLVMSSVLHFRLHLDEIHGEKIV